MIKTLYIESGVTEKEMLTYHSEYISSGFSMGFLEDKHLQAVKDVCFVVKDTKQIGDDFMATIQVLETPMGNLLKEFFESIPEQNFKLVPTWSYDREVILHFFIRPSTIDEIRDIKIKSIINDTDNGDNS